MIAQPNEGAADSAADPPKKKKAVPDMGRGSREQMFKRQPATTRKPAAK